MKGKNLIVFGLGAAGGFIGGSTFVLVKIFESERLRQASAEILADKVWEMLFGDRPHPKESHPHYHQRSRQRVSYKNYYDDRNTRVVDRRIFETRKEAEQMLDAMHKYVEDYGMITLLDYYDLCDFPVHCSQIEDKNYGWLKNDIANARVVHSCHGYMIDLPRTIKLV